MSISPPSYASGRSTDTLNAAVANTSAPSPGRSKTTTSAAGPSGPAKDSVQISDAAKAASAALNKPSQTDNASSARARLDELYKGASADGTFITFDTSKGGRQLDMSQLTDDELAAIAVDHAGSFSQNEAIDAAGWLNLRLAKTLQPFQGATMGGDRRAHAMTLNTLYDNASQNVRQALHWTPAMRSSADVMLKGDNALFGELSWSSIFSNLREMSNNGGMTFGG